MDKASGVRTSGAEAVQVYILPKYTLAFAATRPAETRASLLLATANDVWGVYSACAHIKTRCYDFRRHMYLRQSYVSAYATADGQVLAGHKHYMEAGGHSEHQLFIKGLRDNDCLAPIASGRKVPSREWRKLRRIQNTRRL